MASVRAPKQWSLTKTETVNSFENWKQNLQYTLALDTNFATFLATGTTWLKKSRTAPNRGFVNDPHDAENGRTAAQKVNMLELMLGQVANFCPVISRNSIIKNSTSMDSIWQLIRSHFGFQSTGGHFLDFSDIKLEADERPEDLFQRLMAFIENNLLAHGGGISHHGDDPVEDEELSPTLENMVVLTWLRLLHKDLPQLVRQRYGTELRSRTLASVKAEISQALDSLLDEVHNTSEARVMRSAPQGKAHNKYHDNRPSRGPRKPSHPHKSCPLCRQAARPDNHFLSKCIYLPEEDRKFLTKVRQIASYGDENDNECDSSEESTGFSNHEEIPTLSSNRRVEVKKSPYMNACYNHHAQRITLDTGAEANLIKACVAQFVKAVVTKTTQCALQADGVSPMNVVGETRMIFTRDERSFVFDALVVKNLDVDILGGVPFLEFNDITVRPARQLVRLADGTIYRYGTAISEEELHTTKRVHAHILRAPATPTTVWPGEFLEVDIPIGMHTDEPIAVEPRYDSPVSISSSKAYLWPPPDIITGVGGKVRIPNNTHDPVVLRKHEHFCQVSPVYSPGEPSDMLSQPNNTSNAAPTSAFSHLVKVDPDAMLSENMRNQFLSVTLEYDNVFDANFVGYNGAVGPYEAVVNMGPVQPPQRKGRIPQYSRNKLEDLQNKFDELERKGVFQRPEDLGIVVEYLNPSFLVKKASGGYRLVTAFADVGRYSKPQPALMPDVDSTLRHIAQWKYIIVSDLTSAFYQIPLSRDSMKYCGGVTPFRGVRAYTRSAMGMPGSETALEELMSRVLGDHLQDGIVAKLADDLYCGGNTPEDLLHNWKRVLQAFAKCDLKLSPSKTIIAPRTTVILGWVWSQGTIQASQHRIATLSTCTPPTTIRGLRSFIGAYKILARVLPRCASYLAALDDAVAGRSSPDVVQWSEDLHTAFTNAQQALTSNKVITLPRPKDHLWVVTDGAVKSRGIASTLYVVRDGKPLLAGFFSAKLRQRQVTWLPCDLSLYRNCCEAFQPIYHPVSPPSLHSHR